LCRLAAGLPWAVPLFAQAAQSPPPLAPEAARGAIRQVLSEPAYTQPPFSSAQLAAAAVIAALGALALMFHERKKRQRANTAWASPVYTPMVAASTVTPVIGGAERAWPESPKAALDLLYRGLLARLVSDYHLAVPDNATEAEVLARVASLRLSALEDFTRRLLQQWQRVTYAGLPADDNAWGHLTDSWRRLFPTDVNP